MDPWLNISWSIAQPQVNYRVLFICKASCKMYPSILLVSCVAIHITAHGSCMASYSCIMKASVEDWGDGDGSRRNRKRASRPGLDGPDESNWMSIREEKNQNHTSSSPRSLFSPSLFVRLWVCDGRETMLSCRVWALKGAGSERVGWKEEGWAIFRPVWPFRSKSVWEDLLGHTDTPFLHPQTL